MVDQVANFKKVTVSTGYNNTATSIVLATGQGAELPDPSGDNYNLVWWDSTNYNDPADDPNVEIVRVTAKSTDTLTVTRNQESSGASNKNNADATYKMILPTTAKTITDLIADVERCATVIVGKSGHVDYLTTDYGSDDACIQAAIDYVNGLGGGSVLVREGSYSIENQITMKSYVDIIGSGRHATIFIYDIPEVSGTAILYGEKIYDVVIRNIEFNDESGTYAKNFGPIKTYYETSDDESNWCNGFVLDNCRIVSTNLITTNWHFGFQFHYIKNVVVKDCHIYGVDYGTEFERCYGASVSNCYIDTLDYGVMGSTSLLKRLVINSNHIDATGQGVRIEGGQNIIISNNNIINASGYGAISLVASGSSEVNKSIVSNNTILDCKRGIELGSDSEGIVINSNHIYNVDYGINILSSDSPYNRRIIITNNYLYTAYYDAVAILADSKDIIIESNIFESPDDVGETGINSSISIADGCENVIISNNLFKGIYKRSNPLAVIRKHSAGVSKNISITGNIFNVESGRSGYTLHPFNVRYDTELIEGFIFSNNLIEKYVPTSDTGYGLADIVLKGTTGGVINSNLLLDGVSIDITDATNSNITATNNNGFNPVGAVGPPSVPATTVNYTNAYGYPCQVQIYGGTVTEIDIDDIATGLTSGIFIIPPGGTINITYSAAPSWRWWGL